MAKASRSDLKRVRSAAKFCEAAMQEQARARGDLPGVPLVDLEFLARAAAAASDRAFCISQLSAAGRAVQGTCP